CRPVWILYARTRGHGRRSGPAQPAGERRRGQGGPCRQPVPVHGLREDPRGGAPRRQPSGARGGRMTDQPSRGDLTKALVIDGAAIATVDPDGREWPSGHVVVRDGVIEAVGPGPAPRVEGARRVDGAGCLLTPGLVNTHHHLYQWATRGYATESTLFQWLTELYPIWSRINE